MEIVLDYLHFVCYNKEHMKNLVKTQNKQYSFSLDEISMIIANSINYAHATAVNDKFHAFQFQGAIDSILLSKGVDLSPVYH